MVGPIYLPAALLLTVDTDGKTLTWTGSVTSEPFTISVDDTPTLRLGSSDWIGGNVLTYGGLQVTGLKSSRWHPRDKNLVIGPNGFHADLGGSIFSCSKLFLSRGSRLQEMSFPFTTEGLTRIFNPFWSQLRGWNSFSNLKGVEQGWRILDL